MYILLTAVMCAALCFCVVYPLWLFATTSSHLYSIIIISVLLCFLAFIIIRKLITKYKGQYKKLLFILLTICIILISLYLFVHFVFAEKRAVACIILAAGICLAVFTDRMRKRFSNE